MEKMSIEVEFNPCPKCGNTSFRIFVFSNVYICLKCGWVGNHLDITEKTTSNDSGKQKNRFQRILQLKKLHEHNPEWDKIKLLHSSGEDFLVVDKYWELRDTIGRLFAFPLQT